MKMLDMVRHLTYPGLLKKIEPYRVKNDNELPWVYQAANPKGRYLHDDWAFLKSTPRLDTAYRPPLPFKILRGNADLVQNPLPVDYPLVPGTPFELKPWYDGEKDVLKKWVWMVDPILPAGKWAELMVYLPDNTYEPCYFTGSYAVLGNKIPVYYGLKHDPHPVDSFCWFPELSISVKWGRVA